MKKRVFVILASFLFLSNSNAQNVAYVNRDSVLISVPDYINKLASIEKNKEEFLKEIKDNNAALDQKFKDLLSAYNVQSDESLENLKSRMKSSDTIRLGILLNEEKTIKAKEKSYNDLLMSDYQKDVQPILNKIDNIISNYAIKNKLDFIYDIKAIIPSLVYVNRNKNITKKIISELKNIK